MKKNDNKSKINPSFGNPTTMALFFAIAKNEVTFQHPVCEPHPAT